METHRTARCCWCASGLVKKDGQWWCPTDGCRKKQLQWGIAAQVPLVKDGQMAGFQWKRLFVPLPKQVAFLELAGSANYWAARRGLVSRMWRGLGPIGCA